MKKDTYNKISVITIPLGDASIMPVSNLIDILSTLSQDIYFITGNSGCNLFNDNEKVKTYSITYNLQTNIMLKITNYILLQFKISYLLLKLRKNINICFFYIGSNNLILPIITTKILKKIVVLILPSSSNMLKFANDPFYYVVKIFETINLFFSDIIVLYSSNLIKQWELEQYENKILIAQSQFLDLKKFRIINKFDEKNNCIGYIGRLSSEKGIFNLIKAIPEIITICKSVKFVIIGDGDLKERIKSYLDENNLNGSVKLLGWIPHNELPIYLNKFKLVILPSYTEGLPNVMLESMACGTPVIATAVGAIPDIIKNKVNGFIMEDNSSDCISKNLILALKNPDLEQISYRCRIFVEKEFAFESAVEIYRNLLKMISINI